MARPPALKNDIARFLADAKATPVARPGSRAPRILFALDATASREPTWDLAMGLHGELFRAAAEGGGHAQPLSVQLAYYRGFEEFYASKWSSAPRALLRQMTGVTCRGGLTQIARVLAHALSECQREPIRAAIFIGDACEEPPEELTAQAGKLALFKVPFFVFQEGGDPLAEQVFRAIARITGGAYAPFQAGSADELRVLFRAVARYAADGRRGMDKIEHRLVRGLLAQMP